ncbi:hypothetical protein CYMTET_22770, partial [Cymbomonas tetramitiformis]
MEEGECHEGPWPGDHHSSGSTRYEDRYDEDQYRSRSRRRERSRSRSRSREHDYHRRERGDRSPSDRRRYDDRRRDEDYRRDRSRDHERSHRERERDYDRDYDRHYEDRDRERDRERGREKYRDRSRERSRDRSRERSRERESDRHRDRDRGRDDDKEICYAFIRGDCERGNSCRFSHAGSGSGELTAVAPSATVCLKGLAAETEEGQIAALIEQYVPLRHARVIRDRTTGVSRGFAFLDFPSVDVARQLMESNTRFKLELGGQRLFLEYSRVATAERESSASSLDSLAHKDWACSSCGGVNFARRSECYQCSSKRPDNPRWVDSMGGMEADTPTSVLVINGLEPHTPEKTLSLAIAAIAPVKGEQGLRLVRNKHTLESRGFAFADFYSVSDATKVLTALNGVGIEGQSSKLRVTYARDTRSGSSTKNAAMEAIQAAQYSMQYTSEVKWEPKEFDPNDTTSAAESAAAGFQYDPVSGYYYDTNSGFYYDATSGLYYDGHNQVWYTYDQENQQYTPYVAPTDGTAPAADSTSGGTKKDTKAVAISNTKLHAKNMEKWSQVQATVSNEETGTKRVAASIGSAAKVDTQALAAAKAEAAKAEAVAKAEAAAKAAASQPKKPVAIGGARKLLTKKAAAAQKPAPAAYDPAAAATTPMPPIPMQVLQAPAPVPGAVPQGAIRIG